MAERRVTPQLIETIIVLRERGRSFGQISARLGLSRGTISWHCLKHGAEPPRPGRSWDVPKVMEMRRGNHVVRRYSPEEDARLLALEARGLRIAEIARALGRASNSIRGRLMTLARRDERREAERARERHRA